MYRLLKVRVWMLLQLLTINKKWVKLKMAWVNLLLKWFLQKTISLILYFFKSKIKREKTVTMLETYSFFNFVLNCPVKKIII